MFISMALPGINLKFIGRNIASTVVYYIIVAPCTAEHTQQERTSLKKKINFCHPLFRVVIATS
jgi:hypothetical protein